MDQEIDGKRRVENWAESIEVGTNLSRWSDIRAPLYRNAADGSKIGE